MSITGLMSRAHWRLLARCLIFLFTLVFACSFVALTLLEIYYAGHRPHTPQPGLGQIVRLPWTYPISYGDQGDASLMLWLFSAGFYSWALFGVSWAIRIYILGDDAPLRGGSPRLGRLTRGSPPDDSN
jgi:hypothetical protein